MGRVKGKGKKSVVADHDDTGSGEDEKLPMKRRGRPQKPLKGDAEEEDKLVKLDEDDEIEEIKNPALSKSIKNQASPESGRKRKRPSSQEKENGDLKNEENGANTNGTDLIKSVGYRQNGSRRKSKPRRAAEVGVECT